MSASKETTTTTTATTTKIEAVETTALCFEEALLEPGEGETIENGFPTLAHSNTAVCISAAQSEANQDRQKEELSLNRNNERGGEKQTVDKSNDEDDDDDDRIVGERFHNNNNNNKINKNLNYDQEHDCDESTLEDVPNFFSNCESGDMKSDHSSEKPINGNRNDNNMVNSSSELTLWLSTDDENDNDGDGSVEEMSDDDDDDSGCKKRKRKRKSSPRKASTTKKKSAAQPKRRSNANRKDVGKTKNAETHDERFPHTTTTKNKPRQLKLSPQFMQWKQQLQQQSLPAVTAAQRAPAGMPGNPYHHHWATMQQPMNMGMMAANNPAMQQMQMQQMQQMMMYMMYNPAYAQSMMMQFNPSLAATAATSTATTVPMAPGPVSISPRPVPYATRPTEQSQSSPKIEMGAAARSEVVDLLSDDDGDDDHHHSDRKNKKQNSKKEPHGNEKEEEEKDSYDDNHGSDPVDEDPGKGDDEDDEDNGGKKRKATVEVGPSQNGNTSKNPSQEQFATAQMPQQNTMHQLQQADRFWNMFRNTIESQELQQLRQQKQQEEHYPRDSTAFFPPPHHPQYPVTGATTYSPFFGESPYKEWREKENKDSSKKKKKKDILLPPMLESALEGTSESVKDHIYQFAREMEIEKKTLLKRLEQMEQRLKLEKESKTKLREEIRKLKRENLLVVKLKEEKKQKRLEREEKKKERLEKRAVKIESQNGEDTDNNVNSIPKRQNRKLPKSFDERFEMLVQYHTEHGHLRIPCRESALGCWVMTIRGIYKKMKDDPSLLKSNEEEDILGTQDLNPNRIARLEAIGLEWQLATPKVSWEARFQELLEFKGKFGHTKVTCNKKQHGSLGEWVKQQRKYYKMTPPGISQDRIEKLNLIGFIWDQKIVRLTMEERLQECHEFRAAQGHLCVPNPLQGRAKAETEGYSRKEHSFRVWCRIKRGEYERFMEGNPCKIDQNLIEKLDELGFDWTQRGIKHIAGFGSNASDDENDDNEHDYA